MANIPPELVQSYIHCSNLLFPECSDKLFIGIADNGNHFLEHGIKEGTKLVFDQEKPFEKGQLSCFIDQANKLHLLATQKRGYKHLGRLVATISAF